MKEDSASDPRRPKEGPVQPTYSETEADEIYERAAEMHADTLFDDPSEKLTQDEIEHNAERAGIDEKFVAQAIAERQEEQRQADLKRQESAALRRTWGKRAGIAATLFLLITGTFGWHTKAQLNVRQVDVETRAAQVENVVERRHDLVPALIELTKSSRDRDQALADALRISSERAKNAAPADRAASEAQLGKAIQDAVSVVKADGDPLALRLADQMEGASNRISVERKRYNDAVGRYNEQAGKTPTFLLRILGYPAKYEGFKARENP